MTTTIRFVATSLACLAASAIAGPVTPAIMARFAIGGNDTFYDYLHVDAAAQRLYVAHGNRVDVLRLPDGSVVGAITGMHGVHGIEVLPDRHKGYITDGLDRQVTVFDTRTLAVLARLGPTGLKPDALGFDAASGRLFVVNGGGEGDLSVIDPQSDKILERLPLGGGKLEEIRFDGHGRAFVNDETRSLIIVFDTRTGRKLAQWPLAPCEEPTGLAVDPARHRLYAACGNHKLAVVDSADGRLVAMLPISGDPDGVAFDAKRRVVYVPGREGVLDVYCAAATSAEGRLAVVRTGEGARTIALDESTGILYVPTGKFDRVGERRVLQPGSFSVLAIGPAAASCE